MDSHFLSKRLLTTIIAFENEQPKIYAINMHFNQDINNYIFIENLLP